MTRSVALDGAHSPSAAQTLYARRGKRALDVVLAGMTFVGLAPVLALVSLLIRVDSPGPVLFVQPRLGHHGRLFNAVKFRTMTHRPRPAAGEIALDDPELTRLGRWLRRFKVDELPQVLNVLGGQMSIVGPRPPLPDQARLYDERSARRLLVKPGLTGLAQVNGNVSLPWEERWAFDVLYVEHLCMRLDLRIIARTLAVLVRGEAALAAKPLLPSKAANPLLPSQ